MGCLLLRRTSSGTLGIYSWSWFSIWVKKFIDTILELLFSNIFSILWMPHFIVHCSPEKRSLVPDFYINLCWMYGTLLSFPISQRTLSNSQALIVLDRLLLCTCMIMQCYHIHVIRGWFYTCLDSQFAGHDKGTTTIENFLPDALIQQAGYSFSGPLLIPNPYSNFY